MARSYFPSRAKAVPRAASATAFESAAHNWHAATTRAKTRMEPATIADFYQRPSIVSTRDACPRKNTCSLTAPVGPVSEQFAELPVSRLERQLRAELEGTRVLGAR